jgi:UDP-N-acetylmuramoylalanine--D-glutamate ligase
MKIAIVGWGIEGQSAYNYFGAEHEYLIVNESPVNDMPAESQHVKLQFLKEDGGYGLRGRVGDLSYLDGIEQCDKIIYTPTAYFNLKKKYGDSEEFWSKAKTIQHIFFEEVKTRSIIGVTGTKGKGTTSTLIAKLLDASGKKVHLGGNIGRPVLSFLNDVQAEDWVVLELANFQLRSLDLSPHIAVCLLIEPEHLDWHSSLDDYVEAKGNIFKYQTRDDIAVYYPLNEYSTKISSYSSGKKIPYFQKPGAYVRNDGMIVVGDNETEILSKTKVKLLGEHNLQNICAALTAVWQIDQNPEAYKRLLSEFSSLEHRLELVRELNGVKFFNDSFAATPTAPQAAMDSITGQKVMILGGYDRGLDLSNLAREVKKHESEIRKVIVIGQISGRLGQALDKVGFDNFEITEVANMHDVVAAAVKAAVPGDSVVLSPGAPSFDMFKNFEIRGQEFKEVVNSL